MLSAVATFKLTNGDLFEKQGRHRSLVAANVVSMETLNRRTVMFVEQNGDVYEKTTTGPVELIQRANPNAKPNPNPNPSPVNDWFSKNLANPGIASLARSEFARDGGITFGDMESLFEEVVQSGTITTSEVQDLATLVNNAAGLNMPAYVANLASKVLDPSSADVTFVDWCFSNSAPMPLMQELVDQWFDGTDCQTRSSRPTARQPMTPTTPTPPWVRPATHFRPQRPLLHGCRPGQLGRLLAPGEPRGNGRTRCERHSEHVHRQRQWDLDGPVLRQRIPGLRDRERPVARGYRRS